MTKSITGRITRRGTFIAPDGTAAPATFGRPWRDRVAGRERLRMAVTINGCDYAGIVPANATSVTLARRYSEGAGR